MAIDTLLAEGEHVTDGFFPYTVIADTRDGFATVRSGWGSVERVLKSQLDFNAPPAPKHTPARFASQDKTRQRVLVEGMDCLPGQIDLF